MKRELLTVGIRQHAVFIPTDVNAGNTASLTETTQVLVANAARLGFGFSEDALKAMNTLTPKDKLHILEVLKEITGVGKNWTPLVKGWDVPTGESRRDHLITLIANLVGTKADAKRLPCGHLIPKNTFPLERYNGCPFCGTPFEFGSLTLEYQGSKLKVLELWGHAGMQNYLVSLLQSKTALDATQKDSLNKLLSVYEVPVEVNIEMKETLMLVIDYLVENHREDEVQKHFTSPNDVLRYLWYKHTGFLQLVEPKTIVLRSAKNGYHVNYSQDRTVANAIQTNQELKLKYTRAEGKRVAKWLNNLPMGIEASCENMHPKRSMWVRFIRALRLAEFSKRKGFEKLAQLLDTFYNERYEVTAGKLSTYRLKNNADASFKLLKNRPGLFARSLFANMLWFGPETTLNHFKQVMDQVPMRLLLTLNAYTEIYFDKEGRRSVSPLGGVRKSIGTNQYLSMYTDTDLEVMRKSVEDMCLDKMRDRFAGVKSENKSIYIDKNLDTIPLPIGDRSETVQDLPSALMGARYPLEGSVVRLFMQWGEGLPASHLDMDLSCKVVYEDKTNFCSFSSLVIPGCKHSGDIQYIPEKVGTAEYIDVDVDHLQGKGAMYVVFTCNAYTSGSLSPNMVVGWMDSKYPMRISRKTGVAYDPSCVQQQIRISRTLSKGMVFGVLNVQSREMVWLEMSFHGQLVQNMNLRNVETLLKKLDSKTTIGKLLDIKASAQNLQKVDDPTIADEVYDTTWAANASAVSALFID